MDCLGRVIRHAFLEKVWHSEWSLRFQTSSPGLVLLCLPPPDQDVGSQLLLHAMLACLPASHCVMMHVDSESISQRPIKCLIL